MTKKYLTTAIYNFVVSRIKLKWEQYQKAKVKYYYEAMYTAFYDVMAVHYKAVEENNVSNNETLLFKYRYRDGRDFLKGYSPSMLHKLTNMQESQND